MTVEQVYKMLTSQRFATWYNVKLVAHVENSCISRDTIMADIAHMLGESKRVERIPIAMGVTTPGIWPDIDRPYRDGRDADGNPLECDWRA